VLDSISYLWHNTGGGQYLAAAIMSRQTTVPALCHYVHLNSSSYSEKIAARKKWCDTI